MNKSGQLTRARKEAFLEAFGQSGIISIACRASGVGRTTAYGWKREDEFFAKAWDEAEESSHELLVSEARRRGQEGYQEFVVSGGRLVRNDDGTPLLQSRYSDHLLKFLIERREGKPTQRIEGFGDITKPTEIAPAYLAEVLTELDRQRALATREDTN